MHTTSATPLGVPPLPSSPSSPSSSSSLNWNVDIPSLFFPPPLPPFSSSLFLSFPFSLPLSFPLLPPSSQPSLSLCVPPPSSSFFCSYPSWPLSLLSCLLCGNITTSACMLFCGSQILSLLLCQEPGVVETLSLCTEGVDSLYIFESLC